MLVVLVSEQSISIHGHYSSSFLYLNQNITVSKENGKYDKFIKEIALAELASPESSGFNWLCVTDKSIYIIWGLTWHILKRMLICLFKPQASKQSHCVSS